MVSCFETMSFRAASGNVSCRGDGAIDAWPRCDEAPPGRVACRRWYDGLFRALRSLGPPVEYPEAAMNVNDMADFMNRES